MLFSNHPRTHYTRAPLREVVCQLRFPTILSINTTEPADFQEKIRDAFPRYTRRQENVPPQMVMVEGKPQLQAQPPISNYTFLSEDNRWKLNLTKDFIALSTLSYPGWEDFARQLDRPLAAFIELYHPAFFQRVGLRYVNLVSRSALGLEDYWWDELIAPAYSAVFGQDDATERNILTSATDLTLQLDAACRAKIHAGPGRVKTSPPGAPETSEVRFIFDMDLSMAGKLPCNQTAPALELLHGHGTRLFEGAITDMLREAMGQE